MTDLAKLVVSLEAESAKLRTDLDKANKHLDGFARQAKKTTDISKKAFVGLAAAIPVAAINSALDKASDAASEFRNLTTRLGGSVEEWSRLAYAAEQTDVGFQAAATAAQRMTRRIAEAANGSGEAVGALNELGLSAEKLKDPTPVQQMKVLADAFEGVEKKSDKVRLAMKLFDSEGVKLLQTLDGGSAKLEEFERKADRLGITLTEAGANNLAKYELAMKDMKASSEALSQTLAVALGPSVAEVTKWFSVKTPEAVSIAGESLEAFRHFALEIAADTQNVLHRLAGGSSWIAGKIGLDELQRALDETAKFYGRSEENIRKFQLDLALASDEAEGFAINLGKPLPFLDDLAGKNERAAKNTERLTEAQKAFKRAMQEGKRLTQSLRTPFEVMNDEMERANELLDMGAISWDTYNRALGKARDDYQRAMKNMFDDSRNGRTAIDELESAVNGWGRSFADELLEQEVNLKNFVNTAIKELARISITHLTEPYFKSFGSMVVGGFSDLLGFANGGSFTVGGTGGTDSQLVAFRASPNERVTIETPHQQRAGGGGLVINSMPIDARGSTDPMATEQAVYRAVRMAVNESVATMRDLKSRGSLPEFQ